jgi:hypothetical protein
VTGAVAIVGDAAEARRRLAGRNRVSPLQAYALLHMGAEEFDAYDAGPRVRWERGGLPADPDLLAGYTAEARRATLGVLLLLGYAPLQFGATTAYGRPDVWGEDLDRLCRGLGAGAEASLH